MIKQASAISLLGKVLGLLSLAILPCVIGAGSAEPGLIAYEQQALSQSFQRWIELAEQGDAQAQYRISRLFLEGAGVESSTAESMRWLKYSARGGYAPAQYLLGEIFRTGDGEKQDLWLAFHWLEKSARQGYVKAQCQLGRLLFRGEGVAQDLEAALSWARQAEIGGSKEAVALAAEISAILREDAMISEPETDQPSTLAESANTVGSQTGSVSQEVGHSGGASIGIGDEARMNLEWILGQKSDLYTLQVFSTRSRESALRVKEMFDNGFPSGVFPFARGNVPWYGVIVGALEKARSAEAIRSRLPGELLKTDPWVRTFGRVQAEIERSSHRKPKDD